MIRMSGWFFSVECPRVRPSVFVFCLVFSVRFRVIAGCPTGTRPFEGVENQRSPAAQVTLVSYQSFICTAHAKGGKFPSTKGPSNT